MAKIMLVEDDNNLREIYAARLQAEGYDIVAARDGEEALALAVKEKPDLIISDVMMPRISGFDMLDILRNAPETKDTKVIMMTALSQAEDKSRADKLGADRYLVKSQVTLEDVASVVHEVLEGGGKPAEEAASDVAPALPLQETATQAPQPQPQPQPEPVAAPPMAAPAAVPVAAPSQPEPVAAAPPAPQPAPPVTAAPQPQPQPVIQTPRPMAAAPTPEPPEPQPVTPEIIPVSDPTPTSQTPTLPIVADDSDTELIDDPLKAIAEELARNAQGEQAIETTPPSSAPIQSTPEEPVHVQVPQPQPEPTPSPSPVEQPITVELPTQNTPPQTVPTSESPIPAISNGSPLSNVVAPTQPALAPVEDKPAAPPPSGVETSNNTAGMRVIQPINDPLAKPDLNKLLADEERKAAVQNPSANTIITPEGSTAPTVQPPKNDEFNNIAL